MEPFRANLAVAFQNGQKPLFYVRFEWYVSWAMTDSVSKADALEPVEAVLVDVLRMVLRGRSDEVAPRIRKIVTTTAGRRRAKLSEPARAAIALLLSEGSHQPAEVRTTRGSQRAAATRMPDHRVGPSAYVETDAPAPVLSEEGRAALDGLIREHRERGRLEESGLHPTRTVLLSGPPGTGKSMTMAFLAKELGHPVIRIEPADVIGSFLGESAKLLSRVFEEAKAAGAILVLDEIDALAKRRDDLYDVGEFKRFVTTLLMELDRWPAQAPLIAATNHLDLLDPALGRRFEMHLRLEPPGLNERREILERTVAQLEEPVSTPVLDTVAAVMEGATGADLTDLARRAARRYVLDAEPLEHALLTASMRNSSRTLDRETRVKFAVAAHDRGGLSTRKIGELLGCSHTAVGRLVKAGSGVSKPPEVQRVSDG